MKLKLYLIDDGACVGLLENIRFTMAKNVFHAAKVFFRIRDDFVMSRHLFDG